MLRKFLGIVTGSVKNILLVRSSRTSSPELLLCEKTPIIETNDVDSKLHDD